MVSFEITLYLTDTRAVADVCNGIHSPAQLGLIFEVEMARRPKQRNKQTLTRFCQDIQAPDLAELSPHTVTLLDLLPRHSQTSFSPASGSLPHSPIAHIKTSSTRLPNLLAPLTLYGLFRAQSDPASKCAFRKARPWCLN